MKRLLWSGLASLAFFYCGEARADGWYLGIRGYQLQINSAKIVRDLEETNRFLYQNVTAPLVKKLENTGVEVVITAGEVDIMRGRVRGPSIIIRPTTSK